jgi:hypothetical protein
MSRMRIVCAGIAFSAAAAGMWSTSPAAVPVCRQVAAMVSVSAMSSHSPATPLNSLKQRVKFQRQ